MSLKNKSTIFESVSQRMDHIDPSVIRLIEDRLLIRELADNEKIGSIVIPEDARGNGRYREGIVVATGPGNRFIEMGITDDGQVRRRLITNGECDHCQGGQLFDMRAYQLVDCPACFGGGKRPVSVPCSCKTGDRVLFDRRKEAEIYINGEIYILLYEEQAIIGIL